MLQSCAVGESIGQKNASGKDGHNSFNRFPSKETRLGLHDMWLVNIARDGFVPFGYKSFKSVSRVT